MKLKIVLATAALVALAGQVGAKVSPEEAKKLDGPELTCMGAEKKGSESGVAEFTGKFVGTWPGQTKKYGYEPGPYADEKPLFTITADNMGKYADKLTDGEKALLKAYPKDYRMNVYQSHRDFGYEPWVCDVVKKNAVEAEVIHDGLGVKGTSGAHPFPFPQSGLEAIWNSINPHRTMSERAVCDIADVYSNGSIAWGRNKFQTYNPGLDPKKRGSFQDKINAYFYSGYLLPERDKGFTAVGYQPNDFTHEGTMSWQYLPGLRRVRQAPEVGFDYPVPPAGLRTVDDDYVFNGSPERYTWKLVGKKEFYLPYHNFKMNATDIKYKDLIKPNTINPDYVRYELHRFWVIEGTLKSGVRHIYARRMIYSDEDTWLAMWADNFDAHAQLWRTAFVAYFYSQESKSFHRGASVYHDLQSHVYEAGYLTNEAGDNWWRLDEPMSPSMFSPDSIARGGH